MAASRPELLTSLSDDDVAAVNALGVPITLRSGDQLFDLGDVADRLFQVRRGRIALTLPMQIRDRRQDIVVEEKGPGDTLGWSALVPPHKFTLRAHASVDTELVAYARERLVEHFAAHPRVGYIVGLNVAAVIGHRLQVIQAMWLREIQRAIAARHA